MSEQKPAPLYKVYKSPRTGRWEYDEMTPEEREQPAGGFPGWAWISDRTAALNLRNRLSVQDSWVEESEPLPKVENPPWWWKLLPPPVRAYIILKQMEKMMSIIADPKTPERLRASGEAMVDMIRVLQGKDKLP